MSSIDRCRVTEELNKNEIAEAKSMSSSDLELLNVGLTAVKWFIDDDNTNDCLEEMQNAFRAEDAMNAEFLFVAEWLTALLKCTSYREFKELSNQSCIEWITFSMSQDGYEFDNIKTALRLIGDNPMSINWNEYE